MLSTDLAAAPGDRVLPDFAGRSILNLVTSLTAQLGLPPASPLYTGALPLDGVERVVLFVVDGLGHYLLDRHLERGEMPWLAAQLGTGRAGYGTATSTFPSSTMIALTTLHLGVPPAEHGWLGTTVLDGDGVTDLLRQTNVLEARPLPDPDTLMAASSVYSRLADIGVASGYVTPAAYEGQFLDRYYFRGGRPFRYSAASPLPEQVTAAHREAPYVMVYWPEYDTTNHLYGPHSAESVSAARSVDDLLQRTVQTLPQDGRTLLLITADHGQTGTPPADTLTVPGTAPGGENRVRYLRAAADLGDRVTVVPSADLWERGLYGGPPARPEFRDRTGTFTAVAEGPVQLIYDYGAGPLVLRGNHGGWSAEEMVVPVITLRR